MIETAPYLRNRFQRVLPQYQRFLDSVGAPTTEYSVAPEARPGSAVVAVYGPENFGEDSYATAMTITAGAGVTITTGLDSALFVTAQIFADPAALASLRTVDIAAPEPLLLVHFAIAPEMMKLKIAGWAAGYFIAPDAVGYAFFSVDTHGEVSIEARSNTLAGVAFYVATWRRAEASNLSERIAEFADTH